MIVTNNKRAARLKRVFFLVSLLMALFMLAMFLTDKILVALLTGGSFIIWFLIFQFFDFQYIEYISENGKIILRYYSAIKFGKRDYSMIETGWGNLYDIKMDTTFFKLAADLTIIVKTKRGIAEYPAVSLSAVSADDRKKIEDDLNRLLGK
jgi:hypothetical protein